MNPVDLSTVKQAHFVGIGGCGMSGAARILLHRGVRVTGSDQTPGHIARDLESQGVRLMTGHAPEHVLPGTDLVVMTAAASASNPELLEAMWRELDAARHKGAADISIDQPVPGDAPVSAR